MPAAKRKGKQAKGKAKQPKQEGQVAVSHKVAIPIDEGFNLLGRSRKYCCVEWLRLILLALLRGRSPF